MKIQLINLKISDKEAQNEIKQTILDVIDRRDFILGKDVQEFENNFAKFIGTKYAVGVSSGTSALLISLKALGIMQDDKVITTPFTFTATGEVIIHCNAIPVFVDINEDTFNLNLNEVERCLKEVKGIKAILAVHLYGLPCDIEKLKALSEKYKIFLVEDACQAHGAEYSWQVVGGKRQVKKVGSIGDLGCFSFYPTKNIGGYGDGGIITTNNDELYEKVIRLRNHGRSAHYMYEIIGYNARLDNIQAAILNVKLKYISKWNKQRKEIAMRYNKELNNIGDIITQKISENYKHVYHLYVIKTKYRDKLINYLKENDIGCGIQYEIPLNKQKAYENLSINFGDLSIANKVSQEVLSIPLYPGLKEEEIEFIINKIKLFFKNLKSNI